MADNVAQQIKNLSDEIARLDKGLENTKALADNIFENSTNIGDALQKSFRKGDDAAKETTAVLKELLKTITDNFGKGKELKLAIGIEKNKLRHEIAEAEDIIRQSGKNNSQKYVDYIKTYKQQLAHLSNFERTFADINNVINGDNGKQQSQISKQRVKDEKDVQKIQEQTTAALQKRIELEERLKTLKPNGKAWRDTKAEIENVNKEVQNYLAKMGSLGTAGARQIKAYEKAGLITNADKTQLALERQQIDLLRQRMQAEEQLNRLLLQRNNATLAGKTVSPKVADSISRLQDRIDAIDKQRIGSYQNFTQVSLQRIEGMWQNHETALTNIKTQGAQARQRVLDRQTADEQKAIEQQRKLAQRYAEIEDLRNKALGGKKYGELNKTELTQWQNFSTLLADVKRQMDAIESKHPGSLLKGQSLQSTDALLQQTKENIRQRDIESKRQAAAEEKKIERELVEEAKRAAKEKSDAEKQRLEIERENLRNWQAANKAATQEADRLAKAQAKARSAEAKQTFKRTDSESVSNLKRQAEIKQQIARIDHERQIRAKTNSQISTQQAEAERKSYSALQSELSKLISQQKERERLLRGTTAQASTKIGGYADRLQVQEAQRYRQELEKIGRQQEKNKRGLEDMLPTLQRLAGAFGVAFSVQGLVQFGKKLVETRGEFELQQVAMRSILQNKQLADEIWDKTMQAALQSPFTAMQLTKYTKQLAAYRIETEKLFDTTKMLADVSAGLGVDMQRLILAYGQVKAANYLRASEIRQFTEAGVNILGELSQYFTETRGQMYSTAQVMDMVQKRMVKFGDVEEIFKRMTREGGIFYDMQYTQSQTVKGQINKLHDAYDQMLNNIGKANQGTIRDFVALLNKIVKNWREWKTVLDTIAWTLMITSVARFGKGLLTVGSSARLAKGELKGLEKAGTSLRNVIGKVNPWMIFAAAVTAATFALINHKKAVKAIQQEIDEQNLRLYETNDQLRGYQKTLEANNKAITENAQKKSEEKLSEEELNKKREESRKILAKLKSDYPQLAEGMELMRDGTVKLTNALSLYVQEMERVMTINNLMGQTSGTFLGGLFSDTVKTNMQEWETDLSQLKGELISMQSAATMGMMTLEQGGLKIDEYPLFALLKQIKELDISDVNEAAKKYEEIRKKIIDVAGEKEQRTARGYTYTVNTGKLPDWLGLGGLTKFEHDLPTVTKDFRDKVLPVLNSNFEWAVEQVGEYSEKITNEYGGDVLKFVAQNAKLINEGVTKGNADVVKVIRKSLNDAGIGLTKESREFYNKILNEQIRATQIQEALIDIPFANITERMEKMQEIARNYVPIDFFAAPTGGGAGGDGGDDKKSKIDAAWRRRISLLEEMKKRYDELSKSAYGYQKSEQEVRKAFDDFINEKGIKELGSFSKIFEGTGITMDMIDFTSMEGMFKSLKLALQQAEGISDAVREEIMKKIDSYEAQITISAQVRIREDFGRQIEEAFSNYELTLELDKLNLPKGLAAEMWGIEEVDLSQLRGRLNELFQGLKDQNGEVAEDSLKAYEGYLKKIDDLEQKQQRERLKDYAKYIEAQYSDRVKLEMDYVRKVAKLEAETAISPEQRAAIRAGIDKEYNEAVKKQDWEDFKGSEFYVQMMEDLEKQGTASLEVMREKLEEMRKNAENLMPRALKEVVNSLEKIDEIERGRTAPLQRLKKALDDLGDTNMSEVYKSLAANQKQLSVQEEQKRQLEEMIMLENERNRLKDEGINLDEITSDAANAQLRSAEDLLRLTNIRYNEFKSDGSDESNKQLQGLLEQVNQQKAIVELWQKIVQMLAGNQTIKDIGKDNPYMGMSISDLNNAKEALEEQIKNTNNNISAQRKLVRIAKALQQAWYDTFESIKDYAQRIGGIFDGVTETIDYFADSTNSLAAEWREFGNTAVSALSDLVSGIQAYKDAKDKAEKGDAVAGLMSGNMLKLALVILGFIIKIIQAIARFQDSAIDKEIERSRQRVDELSRAYERLEKSIEKTFKTADYMANYNEQMQNLREQLAAAEAQISAASQYKDEDKKRDALNSARDAKDQVLDMMDEIEQRQLETFGGIGKDNYRSWAEGFVDAWKDAFLETGDGLDALQDHFDEFLQDWFVKQATMRIAGKALEGVMGDIDKVVSDNGVVDWAELQRVKDQMNMLLSQLSEDLANFAGMWDFGGEGGLSGLAAGIQGMTEEQANVLEAYWNSVRMYAASIDGNVSRIAEMLGVGGPNANPMLAQLQNIANNTAFIPQIYDLLNSVRRNNGNGQGFVSYNY